MERKVFIYGLKNDGCSEFRYIGKTYEPERRLKEHLKEKNSKKINHKINWVNYSKKLNEKITLEIIEICDDVNWIDREKYWIDFYKKNGHRLTNILEGGDNPQKIKYHLTYEEARKISRNLNIKTTLEWRNLSKQNKLPETIPKRPDLYYKNNGWVDWSDWLNTHIKSNKHFLKYTDARKIVHSLNMKTNVEWRAYCNSDKRPMTIPSNPDSYYKNKGWVSWSDWLNYDEKRKKQVKKFLSYVDAKKILSNEDLKTHRDWVVYSKTNRPSNIPSNPWRYYSEWEGMVKFLNEKI